MPIDNCPKWINRLTASPLSSDRARWTRFRGSNGSGVAEDKEATPTTWSDKENLKWKIALPGSGVSCPIVVGDKVFVTCYSGCGVNREDVGASTVRLAKRFGKKFSRQPLPRIRTQVVSTGRDSSSFASPIVYQDRLYSVSRKTVTCVNAKTHEKIFEGRFKGPNSEAAAPVQEPGGGGGPGGGGPGGGGSGGGGPGGPGGGGGRGGGWKRGRATGRQLC